MNEVNSGKAFFRGGLWVTHPVVIGVLFFVTLIATFYRGYGFSNNSYAIASWLITYENGFIKRGLIGTILQLETVSRLTGIEVPRLFFLLTNSLLIFLHILVGAILYRIFMRNRWTLLVAPYFLVGPLLRTQAVWIGNIDHLLAILAIGITYCLIKNKIFMASVLSAIGILIHEIIFSMVFPVFIYWISLAYLTDRNFFKNRNNIKLVAVSVLFPVLVVISVIVYQDLFLSGQAADAYIKNMLGRQPQDNYNVGPIAQAYTASFSEWFYSQREDFFNRVFSVNTVIFTCLPIIMILRLACLFLPDKKNIPAVFCMWWVLLTVSPLGIFLVAWDYDRICNLAIWVLFLTLWMWFEKIKCSFVSGRHLGFVAVALFLLGICNHQVRSDISWETSFFIYLPIIVWQIIFIFSISSRGSSSIT